LQEENKWQNTRRKRARELQHDRFRDTTMSFLDRLGNLLEGRGRTILYALGGLLLAGPVDSVC
jgi:hypothetical protein